MNEGLHSTNKQWLNKETQCAKENIGFELDKEYHIYWNCYKIKNIKFYYCITEI